MPIKVTRRILLGVVHEHNHAGGQPNHTCNITPPIGLVVFVKCYSQEQIRKRCTAASYMPVLAESVNSMKEVRNCVIYITNQQQTKADYNLTI